MRVLFLTGILFTGLLTQGQTDSGSATRTDSISSNLYFDPLFMSPGVTWGFRAGMNFGQISGTGAQGFNKFGFSGGIFLDWYFADEWSFKPEVLYSMKGSRRNPKPDKEDYYTYDISLDYIEVPTVFCYHFDWKDRFVFEFGPTFSFLVRQKITENGGELNDGRNFHLFDLSLMAGFNFQFHPNWQFYAKYTNSIMPIRPSLSGQYLPLWGNIGQVHSLFSAGLQIRIQKNPYKKTKAPKPPKPRKQRGDVIDED